MSLNAQFEVVKTAILKRLATLIEQLGTSNPYNDETTFLDVRRFNITFDGLYVTHIGSRIAMAGFVAYTHDGSCYGFSSLMEQKTQWVIDMLDKLTLEEPLLRREVVVNIRALVDEDQLSPQDIDRNTAGRYPIQLDKNVPLNALAAATKDFITKHKPIYVVDDFEISAVDFQGQSLDVAINLTFVHTSSKLPTLSSEVKPQ